jgi:hypothetical protein
MGELSQRGMVLLRATIGILDKNRATNTRVIDEQWVAEARNELVAMAPWLAGVSICDDARWAMSQQLAERGATCSAEKLAKRVIWVECALRTLLVAGVDTDEGWDDAMQLALDEQASAEEDLNDQVQLSAVACKTLASAHRYFKDGFDTTWSSPTRTGGASAAVTRGGVWRLWCSMAKARKEGVFFEGTKANERMIKCEADSHGVGIRGSVRNPGDKLPPTAPLPDKEGCVGDLYAAHMRVEKEHVAEALEATAGVREEFEWAAVAMAAGGRLHHGVKTPHREDAISAGAEPFPLQ